MNKLLAFCLMLLAFSSCDKDDETQSLCGTRLEMLQDYFPLQIGNNWEFELRGKRVVTQIQGLNGKDYFEIVDAYQTSRFYRVENDQVFVRSLEGEEELIFDLAAEVNTTWNYGVGKITLTDRHASVTIGDIQIDDCLMFIFHNEDLIDYGGSVCLAPGIGFIQETCQECFGQGFSLLQLKSALINNEKIGF